MNTLEKLLEKLCPNGVEYKQLGEVCQYKRTQALTKDQLDPNGFYPVVNSTTGIYGWYTAFNNEGDSIIIASHGVNAGNISYITGKYWAGALCYPYQPKDTMSVEAKYIYYVLKNQQMDLRYKLISAGSIPFINRSSLDKYLIPIPPIPVQKEIVRVLDDMAGLIDALEDELAARKKQYEWYRDKLQEMVAVHSKVPLGDLILSLNTGLNPRKFFKLNTPDATNYYVTIREMHDGKIEFSDSTDRINDDALKLCNHRSNLEIGDLLFSGTGTIGEMVVIEDEPINWNIKEGVYAIKPRTDILDSHYLRYILMMSNIRNAYLSKIAGGTVKSIPMAQMKRIEIPLPPLPEQRRIVKILDSFDTLCNSMTEGLPGEIALRKQQYEFYRGKLLTFKKAVRK